jgi:1-acyl-sn-glycerol-3-phosphate acyltransferase
MSNDDGTIPVGEETIEDREMRRRLMGELDALIARVQAMTPDFHAPPFSPRRLLQLIEDNLQHMSPANRLGVLQKLRSAITEDAFDVDTWKGLWYMLNYSLRYQADVLKRRVTGEYETDEWGMDWEFMEAVRPFLSFLYSLYWRVKTSGLENVPDQDRALLVGNHSGQFPWDSLMVAMAVATDHSAQRTVRSLYPAQLATVPFFSALFDKLGQAPSTVENGARLLEQDEIVAVYPEGVKGLSKLYRQRYRLADFGRGGFVKAAIRTSAPLIPVAIVGAEESYLTLGQSSLLANATGLPFFPITLTFPWLGPLGLIPMPSRWYIDFGPAIPTAQHGPDAADNVILVQRVVEEARTLVQDMVNKRLADRRSVLLG